MGQSSRFKCGTWVLVAGLAVSLGITTTATNLWIARTFDAVEAFDETDLLFHADPRTRRFVFAENLPDRILVKHPNLGNFINPPIRAIAKLDRVHDQAAVRWRLALWVVPIAAAIQTVALFLTLLLLHFSTLQSTLLAFASSATFTHLLFASMPESFGLTGAWLAVLLLAGAWSLRMGNLPHRDAGWMLLLWIALAVLGVGITVTNLIPLGIVMAFTGYAGQRPTTRVFRDIVVACLVALIGNVVLLGLTVGPNFNPQMQKNMPVGIRGFVHPHPLRRIVLYPAAVSNAIAPPPPTLLVEPQGLTPYYFTLVRRPQFRSSDYWFRGAIWGLLILGTVGCLRTESHLRNLTFAVLAILVFNGVFHAWWGSEYILYSQHWQAGAVLLIAGSGRFFERSTKWSVIPLLLAAALLALHNGSILQGMLETWIWTSP